MESESECCLFQDSQYSICSGSADGLSEARLQTIDLKSKKRKDDLHLRLVDLSPLGIEEVNNS